MRLFSSVNVVSLSVPGTTWKPIESHQICPIPRIDVMFLAAQSLARASAIAFGEARDEIEQLKPIRLAGDVPILWAKATNVSYGISIVEITIKLLIDGGIACLTSTTSQSILARRRVTVNARGSIVR